MSPNLTTIKTYPAFRLRAIAHLGRETTLNRPETTDTVLLWRSSRFSLGSFVNPLAIAEWKLPGTYLWYCQTFEAEPEIDLRLDENSHPCGPLLSPRQINLYPTGRFWLTPKLGPFMWDIMVLIRAVRYYDAGSLRIDGSIA